MQPANDPHWKEREERRRTVLPARLRVGSSWGDACILNVSARGLMIYASLPVEPGSHIEIRRGSQLVLARVVWRNNQRVGLRSEHPVPVDGLLNGNRTETAAASPARVRVERRKRPRNQEASRDQGRAAEFIAVVLIGMALAVGAAGCVHQALAKPATAVQGALRRH